MDVKSLLLKKQEKASKKLIMKDVNRPLIIALLSIPVYGKEVRDEEILSVIINAGTNDFFTKKMSQIKDAYNTRLKNKELKKTKDGVVDSDGFMVLIPK